MQLRMEEEEVPYDVVTGTSVCRSFTPGGKFTMDEHISGTETGKSYVITSISHSARIGGYSTGGEPTKITYSNSFQLRARLGGAASGADHAQAGGPRLSAGRGGRSAGRGDLARQVWSRQSPVLLGPLRQEGRQELLLDPLHAGVGGSYVGVHVDPAHRPGGDRHLPGRRSGSSDHHRPALQRRPDAALRRCPTRRPRRT